MIVYSNPVVVPPPTSNFWVAGSGYGGSPLQGQPLYYNYSPCASPEMISSSPPQPQGNWNLQPQPLYPQFWCPAPVQYGDASMDSLQYPPEGYGLPPPPPTVPLVNYVFVPTQPLYENQVFTAPCTPVSPSATEEGTWTNFTSSYDSSSSRGLSVMAQPFIPNNGCSSSPATPESIEASNDETPMNFRRAKGGRCCIFCRKNGETREFCESHVLKNEDHTIQCPVLRNHKCPLCGAEGDNAHTLKYCPENEGKVVTPVGMAALKKKAPKRNSRGLINKYKY